MSLPGIQGGIPGIQGGIPGIQVGIPGIQVGIPGMPPTAVLSVATSTVRANLTASKRG